MLPKAPGSQACAYLSMGCIYILSTQVCFRTDNNNIFQVLQQKAASKFRDDRAIKLSHSSYHRQWTNQEFLGKVEELQLI